MKTMQKSMPLTQIKKNKEFERIFAKQLFNEIEIFKD